MEPIGGTVEFKQVVDRRRMVRHYERRPVPSETVERIVRTARRAPSAGFAQAQNFVVVTQDSLRTRIARLAGEEDYVARGFPPWLSTAPVHIVVCADEAAYERRYGAADKAASDPSGWPVPYAVVDAGAALMLLLLAAVDEGLSAGFLGAHRLGGIRELLAVPEHAALIGLVTVGYPAPDRRSGSLQAGWRPLDEVVHGEGWGLDRTT